MREEAEDGFGGGDGSDGGNVFVLFSACFCLRKRAFLLLQNGIREGFVNRAPMAYAFVREGYCAEFCPHEATYAGLYQLSGSISKDKKLIEEISYSYRVEWLPEENLGTYTKVDYFPSATYRTRYAGFAEASEFFRDESFLTGATVRCYQKLNAASRSPRKNMRPCAASVLRRGGGGAMQPGYTEG